MTYRHQIPIDKNLVSHGFLGYLSSVLPEAKMTYRDNQLCFEYPNESYRQVIQEQVGQTREMMYFLEVQRLRAHVDGLEHALLMIFDNGYISHCHMWGGGGETERHQENMETAQSYLEITHIDLGPCPSCECQSIYLYKGELHCAMCGEEDLYYCREDCGELINTKDGLCADCENGDTPDVINSPNQSP